MSFSNVFGFLVAGLVVLAVRCQSAMAQQIPNAPAPPAPNPAKGSSAGVVSQVTIGNFFTTRTPYEFWLTVLVVVMALVILGLLVWAVRSSGQAKPEDFTRPMIVVTIVFSA